MVTKEILNGIIDNFSRNLVGKLCKRIEVLQKHNLTVEQVSLLFKDLAKELVYEEIRTLKRVFCFYVFGEGKEECVFFGKEESKDGKK